MIGIGKSISHTRASISYGWNQEKEAEIIYKEHLMGETPREIAQEFKIIQDQNCRCKNNTLSFVLSPTVEDGKKLTQEQLNTLTQKFIQQMQLQNRQSIAFVHRDKAHTHVHIYVNRIGFDGKAYNDSYIGKRSQQAADQVAKEMGLQRARDIQYQRLEAKKQLRQEIKQHHETIMGNQKPKELDQYIKHMKEKGVEVIPVINRQEQLQGLRYQYKGHDYKGSEVHRSLSGGKVMAQIIGNKERTMEITKGMTVQLAGRVVGLSANLALSIAKRVVKQAVKRSIDLGMGI